MADFASLMGAALGKSKNAPSTPKPVANGSPNGENGKNFVRRADLEAQREAAYRAEQAAAEAAREERLVAKRKREEEEAEQKAIREEKRRRLAEESKALREAEEIAEEDKRRKRVGLPSLTEKRAAIAELDSGSTPVPEEEDIEEEELKTKLRGLKEPAVLFAESHAARLKRFKALTSPKAELSNTPIPTTLALLPESEMQVEVTKPPPLKSTERAYLLRQLASYFTMILTEWIRALDARDLAVKASSTGRAAAAAMEQSRDNLRPLFKKFESGDIEEGVLEPVIEIVRAAQKRRYVDANDAYLTLSIGKAAWPIGVTMVGIHERSYVCLSLARLT